MKVYHGGYVAVETPKILKSKFPKDFGEGFYPVIFTVCV